MRKGPPGAPTPLADCYMICPRGRRSVPGAPGLWTSLNKECDSTLGAPPGWLVAGIACFLADIGERT